MSENTGTRTLGRSGIEVSALGLGTWAMGGPFFSGEVSLGWGPTDDAESERALRRAFDLGVTLYDTADAYGTGHAEELLGRVLAPVRDQVVIATKWGNVIDPATRRLTGADGSPEHLRRALDASLRRLGTDRIDLYQLHLNDLDLALAAELRDACEELVAEGKIRGYGWSTDDPARAALFAEGPHCTAVQAEVNVLTDAPDVIDVAESRGLGLLCRGPLAMGLLARTSWDEGLPADDVRRSGVSWMRFFTPDGRPSPGFAAARDALRDVLTSGGRTLAQGAVAWLWARSGSTLPIPGVRTVAQAEENAGALRHGPLTGAELAQVRSVLAA
jgi:aryl-alcohol dehydrogenase-like predicted oxidoreductase